MSAQRQYNNYIDGNTVRQFQTAPEFDRQRYREQEELDRRKRQAERNKRRRQEHAHVRGMDFVSMILLSAAIAVTFFVCIEYLQVQSNKIQMDREISSLENEILELKDRNAAALENVEKNVDLNYIYEVATTKLGMVHPDKNQVIEYESTKSDYLRQYDEIPQTEEANIISSITGE